MDRNCIKHNALANYSNTNTAKSDIDKGMGYFVENHKKNTNKQAFIIAFACCIYAWAIKFINQKICRSYAYMS